MKIRIQNLCLSVLAGFLLPMCAVAQTATSALDLAVHDPSGALIANATVHLRMASLDLTLPVDATGHLHRTGLPAGRLHIDVQAAGFAPVHVDTEISASQQRQLYLTLPLPSAISNVFIDSPDTAAGAPRAFSASAQADSNNAAELIADDAATSMRTNGALATMPLLHGLGDERVAVRVNGAETGNACPNHMNPSLSYVATAAATAIDIQPGAPSVVDGGDSIAGSISVQSAPLSYAAAHASVFSAHAASYYRSNGSNIGGSLELRAANSHLSAVYLGSESSADDYADGSGHRVTSTFAQTSDHLFALGWQSSHDHLRVEAGYHHTPYEGFVNAQMDMVRNVATRLGMDWVHDAERGQLRVHLDEQNTFHLMNVGRDKLQMPMPMWMPMQTHGRDFGYRVELSERLDKRNTLRAVSELHRFRLDDLWPPVDGTAPYMAPNTFINLNNARRTRLGHAADLTTRWSSQWTTVIGLRGDVVWTDADPVQGYSMMYASDATAFNALRHDKSDAMLDASATVRWQPQTNLSVELAYARKNRAPNLYERYAWSRNWMAAGMIGWFGDGNAYVGSVGLHPETANTVSGTVTLSGPSRYPARVVVTPWFTAVDRFIDADVIDSSNYGMTTLAMLRFANHTAHLNGIDAHGSLPLWSGAAGKGQLDATAAWLRGTRTDANLPLYQMMPLHAHVELGETWRSLHGVLLVDAVDRKSRVDAQRFERVTAGYALVGLRAGYQRGPLEAGFTADNLFNRLYALPLGGVNFDDFMNSMWMAELKPLTGRGRSIGLHLAARF